MSPASPGHPVLALAAACVLASGCGGDETASTTQDGFGACLDPLPLDCRPTFEPPTFDAVFDNVLQPACGASATGTQCHGAQGMQGGLVLANRDQAFDSLLGARDGRARVTPGDPECSLLVQRLETADPQLRMPRGSEPLPDGARCAIRQWIANGAAR